MTNCWRMMNQLLPCPRQSRLSLSPCQWKMPRLMRKMELLSPWTWVLLEVPFDALRHRLLRALVAKVLSPRFLVFHVDAGGVGAFPNAVLVLVVASHGFLCCLCVECLRIQFFLGVNGAAACRILTCFLWLASFILGGFELFAKNAAV